MGGSRALLLGEEEREMRQRLRAVVVRGVGEVSARVKPHGVRVEASAGTIVDDAGLRGRPLGQLVGDTEEVSTVVGHVRAEDPEHRNHFTAFFGRRLAEVAEELVSVELDDDHLVLHDQILALVHARQSRDGVVLGSDQTHQLGHETPEKSLPRDGEVPVPGMNPDRGNRFGQGHVLDWTHDRHVVLILFSLGKSHTAQPHAAQLSLSGAILSQ